YCSGWKSMRATTQLSGVSSRSARGSRIGSGWVFGMPTAPLQSRPGESSGLALACFCCTHNNPTSPHRCPGGQPSPLSLGRRDRPYRAHGREGPRGPRGGHAREAGEVGRVLRRAGRLAQLPRRGEADRDAALVLRIRGLGDETAVLELAQQPTEPAAAEDHAAQQIPVPDHLSGQTADERVEFVERQTVPLTEAELELAYEVLMLLHHQPPGRDLDRPVLSDLTADRSRLTCPLVHARSVCPLSLFVATSTRL